MGVEIEKTSQKADWAKRPLTPVMEKYALNDVIYLLPMAEMIVNQLKEKGRYDWFVESCEAAREKAFERKKVKEDRWRIKGGGKLSREGLNYLKTLWDWRDAEAQNWDRPSFMVAGNKQILEWVEDLLNGKAPSLPRHYRSRRIKTFDEAVAKAKSTPESEMPKIIRSPRRRKDSEFDDRLNTLMAQRDKVAESLDIDSSLIASRAPLEALASNQDGAEKLLMNWQRQLMGI